MTEAKFLAFDLGAESGRGVIGLFDGEKLRLEDAHRFANSPVRLLDTLYWDALRLFADLKRGLGIAVAAHGKDFAGVGIDTWGVDFGLLGRNDTLLGNPRHYRDHGNDDMMDVAFQMVPRHQIFARTGIQFMQFNTLIQLLALKTWKSPHLEGAETLLMMPDLFNFWFTGQKTTEFSIASTTQMLDPTTRTWALDLLDRFDLPTNLLTDIVPTGTTIGTLRADIADEAGCGPIPIVAPAEHDTGSAIVAVPAADPDYAYISSGTWSLMGIETREPRISDQTRSANFTNEGGACGTIRLLKNIMGLWLVQECRRNWTRQGKEYSYADLAEMASAAPPFVSLIEPDDVAFLSPTDMTEEIRRFCARTDQPAPDDVGATVRCCLESLALKYRWTMERLEEFRGKRIDTIHIVGGGTQNRLLCQLAADATQRTVIAGPVEATAIGNVLMQAMGRGHIASLEQAREVVRRSFDLVNYTPKGNSADWEQAYARFLALRAKIGKTD
jgi:rhamnulokinase